jgi:hypothetical protein
MRTTIMCTEFVPMSIAAIRIMVESERYRSLYNYRFAQYH